MGIFDDVKDALGENPLHWFNEFGIQWGKKKGRTDGRIRANGVVCHKCGDTDGSASVIVEKGKNIGLMNCFACGAKTEIFEWVAHYNGLNEDATGVCKWMAKRMNIPLKAVTAKSLGRKPHKATPDIVVASQDYLINSGQASQVRAWLERCKLPLDQMLSLGIGATENNKLIYFMHDERTGKLRPGYRVVPFKAGQKQKAFWHGHLGEKRTPNGFWPANDVPNDGKPAHIIITEGESDAASLRLRVDLPPDTYVFAWTGGAVARPDSRLIPESWHNKNFTIIWDVDQFQHPDIKKCLGPHKTRIEAQLDPERSSLKAWADLLEQHNGRVKIGAVPVNPVQHPTGDLRDWIDEGGKSLDEIPTFTPNEIWGERIDDAQEVRFEDIPSLKDGTSVVLKGQVRNIDMETTTVPTTTVIECNMHDPEFASMCSRCGAPDMFPERVIDWGKNQRMLFQAWSSKNPTRALHDAIHKPSGCNSCTFSHRGVKAETFWSMMDQDDSSKSINVVGGQPAISGRMEVKGRVYTTRDLKSKGVYASSVREIDATDIVLDPLDISLLETQTPTGEADQDGIQKYLDGRLLDISANITKIYNRPEIHLCVDLVMHSALWLRIEGERVRGWLDACMFGDTRMGKTVTVERYMKAIELGAVINPMSTVSRAGLLVSSRDGKLTPGVWPKRHGTAIAVDEWHTYSQGKYAESWLIRELQSARDSGMIYSQKDSGDFKLKAAVRLITMANWAPERQAYHLPVHHLRELYMNIPQFISRLDFGWPVMAAGEKSFSEYTTPQLWHKDLLRVSVLRAWSMSEDDIEIDEDALKAARNVMSRWDTFDTEQIPLYTGHDKAYSVLRIATAMANICFSHPLGEPMRCRVRLAHVQWAIAWLERTWREMGYDDHSDAARRAQEVHEVHKVCFYILEKADDHYKGQVLLGDMAKRQPIEELLGLFEWDHPQQGRNFLAILRRHRVFTVDKNEVTPTEGGKLLIKRLHELATHNEKAYDQYVEQINLWFSKMRDAQTKPRDLTQDVDYNHVLYQEFS